MAAAAQESWGEAVECSLLSLPGLGEAGVETHYWKVIHNRGYFCGFLLRYRGKELKLILSPCLSVTGRKLSPKTFFFCSVCESVETGLLPSHAEAQLGFDLILRKMSFLLIAFSKKVFMKY